MVLEIDDHLRPPGRLILAAADLRCGRHKADGRSRGKVAYVFGPAGSLRRRRRAFLQFPSSSVSFFLSYLRGLR
jgi:hypothetical protein